MTTKLIEYGQFIATPLIIRLRLLQARIDKLLISEAEVVEVPGEEQRREFPVWAIILIVIIAVPCLLLLCAVVVIAILTLLGPSIGDVFSGVIEDLETSP